jgi:Peptidase M15
MPVAPAAFAAFIAELSLDDFTAEELLTRTDRPSNSVPPQAIWPNFAPTILTLQAIRTAFGASIRLNSVYRSERYNSHIPDAAALSQHIAFNAIDFAPTDPSRLRALHDLAEGLRDTWLAVPRRFDRRPVTVAAGSIGFTPLEWRETGGRVEFRFRGGLKLYNTFIHIDTRGQNVNWG